jgi:hypothetical protein
MKNASEEGVRNESAALPSAAAGQEPAVINGGFRVGRLRARTRRVGACEKRNTSLGHRSTRKRL